MPKALRLLAALLAIFSLTVALAACGGDDSEDASDDTEESTTTTGADDGDEGDEAPDTNPCAEGESGDVFPTIPPEDGATEVSTTATEYAFADIPDEVDAGDYALTFINAGAELHEAIVTRINDDETRSVEELLGAVAAGETDPATFSTDVGQAFACPGSTAEATAVDLTEPGRYVVLCFVPVGTLPSTDPAEFDTLGPPHAAQGMVHEFTVA